MPKRVNHKKSQPVPKTESDDVVVAPAKEVAEKNLNYDYVGKAVMTLVFYREDNSPIMLYSNPGSAISVPDTPKNQVQVSNYLKHKLLKPKK